MSLWLPNHDKPLGPPMPRYLHQCPRCPGSEMKTTSPPICGSCGARMPEEGSIEAKVLKVLGDYDKAHDRWHHKAELFDAGYYEGIEDTLIELGLAGIGPDFKLHPKYML